MIYRHDPVRPLIVPTECTDCESRNVPVETSEALPHPLDRIMWRQAGEFEGIEWEWDTEEFPSLEAMDTIEAIGDGAGEVIILLV